MNATAFYSPHHTSQVFSSSPQSSSSSSGHVYTTEIYPPSFLPSSSESSPAESPVLLPKRTHPFNNVNDHFTLDGSGNNNNNAQQREIVFAAAPVVNNNNQRAVKRRGSKASIRSNRNSIFLDPIVEETNDFGSTNNH